MTGPIRTPRTRIVATVGPATEDVAMLQRLLESGVDVFRLNLSHGTVDAHRETMARIREIERDRDRSVAVLADLPGPKIRLAAGSHDTIEAGQTWRLVGEAPAEATADRWMAIPIAAVRESLTPGDRVLLDDGAIRLLVTRAAGDLVECRALGDGVLRPRMGVNLPDSDPGLDAVNPQDLAFARTMAEAGCDLIAVSFCRDGDDIRRLREALAVDSGPVPALVAKIERPSALEHLADIVDASDAILVARGDLGVEMDLAAVPVVQKEIVEASIRGGKPVIVATQMLQSMIEAPAPTRAEATDVANAVIDGADALMLSGETAIGRHPVLSVETLRRIAGRTEAWLDGRTGAADGTIGDPVDPDHPWLSGLAGGIGGIVRTLGAAGVVAWTSSGDTARLLSRARLPVPLVMLTDDIRTVRMMRMLAGVVPVLLERDPGIGDPFIEVADRTMRSLGLVEGGEPIVFLHGSGRRRARPTDVLGVFEAGSGSVTT